MGVLDRFLNAMKLNDNDGFDDDDFLDDEMDDFEEEAPKKRFFKKQNEEDDLGDLDMRKCLPEKKRARQNLSRNPEALLLRVRTVHHLQRPATPVRFLRCVRQKNPLPEWKYV